MSSSSLFLINIIPRSTPFIKYMNIVRSLSSEPVSIKESSTILLSAEDDHSNNYSPNQSLSSQTQGIKESTATLSKQQQNSPLPSLNANQYDQSFYGVAGFLGRETLAFKTYILHVQAGFNNTLVTITDHAGNVISFSSGGKAGFKKAQRAGYEPAYQATRQVLNALENKLGQTSRVAGLHLKFKGFGPGRDAAWKCTLANQWKVIMVEDVTPLAFGGCRPRKARRL